MTGKQMLKLYKENGWTHKRTTGSHFIMFKNGFSESIPIHAGKELKAGTQHSLLKRLKEVK